MFAFRDHCDLDPGTARVEVAFTDATLNLQGGRPGFADALDRLAAESGVRFARMSQIHGDDVIDVEGPSSADADVPVADAMVTTGTGFGLMVRVADCVPVVLADPQAGVLGVAHAGRKGVQVGVVDRVVERMRDKGADAIRAWVGPHICGRCYEVPDDMRAEVAAVAPATYAETRWGTPGLDLGAGVVAQLTQAGVGAHRVDGCTLEESRFHSYRRDKDSSGRMAGLVWMS